MLRNVIDKAFWNKWTGTDEREAANPIIICMWNDDDDNGQLVIVIGYD